ncbi:MAG: carbohydrate binding family 9 domain-containing protein [Bacteroidales bacterium]|nr:carbohydrate binding family 9 domain-containing protein [Bacteroidales bacterium]
MIYLNKHISFTFFFILLVSALNLSGQTAKKSIKAVRISKPPKIDGILNDRVWENIPVATDFFQFDPYNGEPATQKTEIKIAYNDNALFIGAMMFDTAPDSILTGLAKRDDFEYINADILTIDISPYNDGLYAFSYKVSASGVQGDEKFSPSEKDVNWDAVWESCVKINDKGWVAEIKIPYSAIRFPKKDIQIWGINFWRNIRRKREWATWTFVNKKISSVSSISRINKS